MTMIHLLVHAVLAVPPPDQAPPTTPGGGGGGGGGGIFGSLLPFLLILVIFMVIMPLFSKKERHRRKRLTSLKKHDKVVTSGGIFGTIVALDEQTVTLEVSRDVRMKFKRSSVFDVERAEEAAAGKAKAEAKG